MWGRVHQPGRCCETNLWSSVYSKHRHGRLIISLTTCLTTCFRCHHIIASCRHLPAFHHACLVALLQDCASLALVMVPKRNLKAGCHGADPGIRQVLAEP